jgi:hypothetical protein
MLYPVLVSRTKINTIVARCPLGSGFSAEGATTDEALMKLGAVFSCFLHDNDIRIQVIAVDRSDYYLYGAGQ